MDPEIVIALLGLNIALFFGLFLLWLSNRRERTARADLSHRLHQLAGAVDEMVQWNESAFRTVTRSVRSLEDEVQRGDRNTPPSPVERKHRILGLARRGLTAEEITRQLNLPRAEVDLIVNLGHLLQPDARPPAHTH